MDQHLLVSDHIKGRNPAVEYYSVDIKMDVEMIYMNNNNANLE